MMDSPAVCVNSRLIGLALPVWSCVQTFVLARRFSLCPHWRLWELPRKEVVIGTWLFWRCSCYTSSISAAVAWRRQKQTAQPLTLAALESPKICRAAGYSSNCRLLARKQIVPCSSLCTKPYGLLRLYFQSKMYRIPGGGAPWGMKSCIKVHLNYHANRITSL